MFVLVFVLVPFCQDRIRGCRFIFDMSFGVVGCVEESRILAEVEAES